MISDFKFIPVVVINDIKDTEHFLGELCKGGLPCAEITFRTACAADAIKLGKELFYRLGTVPLSSSKYGATEFLERLLQ